MGKASKGKKTKSIPEQKPADAGTSSDRGKFFRNPFVHISLIALIGIIIYSNTFNHQFVFDDIYNIVDNYSIRDLSHLSLKESRWFCFLTFSLNYQIEGLNTPGYHIVNLAIHILNAVLVYFFILLTFKTPFFKKITQSSLFPLAPPMSPLSKGGIKEGFIAFFSSLLFVSHPIQTQAVTYIVQRLASLATMFYLLSLVMYIKFRMQSSELKTQNFKLKSFLYLCSVFSAVLAMKTKEISFTLPVIITLYEFMFFDGKIKKRIINLIPLLLTMFIIPLSLMGTDKPIGDLIGDVSEATRLQTDVSRWDYLFTQFRVMVTYIRLLFLPTNQTLDYDYPIYNSFLNLNVFLSFLLLLSIFSLGGYLLFRSRFTVHGSPSPNSKLQTHRFTVHYPLFIIHGLLPLVFSGSL